MQLNSALGCKDIPACCPQNSERGQQEKTDELVSRSVEEVRSVQRSRKTEGILDVRPLQRDLRDCGVSP